MRGWLVVALLSSTAACSLIVGTDGLSGGATGDGGTTAPGSDASDETSTKPSDASSDTCIGSGCVAPPITPCDGPCLPVLISTDTDAKGIAADESGVYWTALGDGDVKRANVDGTGVTTLFDGNQAPTLLALDDTFVYWTETNSGLVSAVRKDANHGSRVTLSGQADVSAIAVSNGEVFFHLRTTGEVKRGPTALTTATLLTTETSGKVPRLVADNQFVYVGVTGPTNRVRRAPRATATATPTDLTARGTDFFEFAIDSTRVYSARGSDGLVVSERIDGTGDAVTYASGEATPSCVAVDDTYVYWGDRDSGLVKRTTKTAGGAVETLASGQVQPFAIAVNSRAVYWLNTNGAVMTIRKP
ncbi:MAG: uncharacterized protein JWO86_567 [Myxococcaceae bacterium]|nr:uncharacterized protein [Myxococcaceae bacterium]